MNGLNTTHVDSVRYKRRLSHSVLWLVVSPEAYDGGLRFFIYPGAMAHETIRVTIKNMGIMKNVIYYTSLAVLWAIIHILLSMVMIAIGIVEQSAPHALIISALLPEIWLLSIGIAMLPRGVLAKHILHEEKMYSKTVPTVLAAFGTLMIGTNILLTSIEKKPTTIEALRDTPITLDIKEIPIADENTYNSNDSLLTETIQDLKSSINQEFEELNRNTPIRIDNITVLNEIEISESGYTCIYQLEIDKDDFNADYLNGIVEDFGEMNKTEFYNDVLVLCEVTGIDPDEFFKAVNIRFKYSFVDINNNNIATYEMDCKDYTTNQ